ncbi:MAG TPA: hypothetical protein ENN99_02100 [Chloroflexi bacterium]|nr:hypothetical protein [Chloroflexota bacterium]
MKLLFQWLVERAWIFYVACAIGVIVYVVRALAARRDRNLALFTLERETAVARAIQAWAMVLVFVAIGAAVFVSTTFVLPNLAGDWETLFPTSTPSSGVDLPTSTPGIAPTPSPTLGSVVATITPTPTRTLAATPAVPLSEPTETVTPAPTEIPAAASGNMQVQFGDFALLTGFSLSVAEVTTSQPVPLTLYWQGLAGGSPVDYLVFTHLIADDGRLIAQHDGIPGGGSRPTTGWAAGETIVDPHPLAFYDAEYTGPARIAVGLYEPSAGRVLTRSGDDYVFLPVTVMVVAQ